MLNKIFFFFVIFQISCATPKMKLHFSNIEIKQGLVLSDNPADFAEAQIQTKQLFEQVKLLIQGIVEKNTEILLNEISDSELVYIDVKAPQKKEKVREMLSDSTSYLYVLFWNSKELTKMYPQTKVISYQELFQSSEKISIDFFFYSQTQCEIKIQLEPLNPVKKTILNNPIYKRIENKWYIVQLP